VVTLFAASTIKKHAPTPKQQTRMVVRMVLKNVNIFYDLTRHHHVQIDLGALSTHHSATTGELFARERRGRTLYLASQLRVSEVIRQ
jgi:hypothetical protein